MSQSVDYAITFTLRPKCFIHEPERQFDDTSSHVLNVLKHICNNVILIAETTKNMNIHYHGICNFLIKDKLQIVKMIHTKFRNDNLVGFICIKQVDDQDKWLSYITKDLADTKKIIGRRPIIINTYTHLLHKEMAEYGSTF